MKNTGQCPKCNSTEIYCNKGNKIGSRAGINVDIWGGFYITVYICADCGYIEEFMSDEHFAKGRMEKVKKKWHKYSKFDK
jgi:predicted nucleic-acid-binding Zn-ribbon protein